MKRTEIINALQLAGEGQLINVRGWVRSRRGNKNVSFIALNDGSTIKNIQIVVDLAQFPEENLKPVTTGSCISATGHLVASQGSGQAVEIQLTELEVYGTADPEQYPLQKKGLSMEYLRTIAHLRPRTNTFGAVFRIRHNMAMAIHQYFHEHGFFYFHTPIITASDCEGAGQMFQVTTKNLYNLKKDEEGKIDYSDDFFGKQTSLTVSGQLEGELAAMALGKIYTFGPTFRAENSNTPRHLAEFWMIEPEVAFIQKDELMDLEEDFIKYCVRWALEHCKDDLEFLNQFVDKGLRSATCHCWNSCAYHRQKPPPSWHNKPSLWQHPCTVCRYLYCNKYSADKQAVTTIWSTHNYGLVLHNRTYDVGTIFLQRFYNYFHPSTLAICYCRAALCHSVWHCATNVSALYRLAPSYGTTHCAV